MENSESIVILDCSKIMDPSKVEQHTMEFSNKLGKALSEIGFAYLINTGVDLQKVRYTYLPTRENSNLFHKFLCPIRYNHFCYSI